MDILVKVSGDLANSEKFYNWLPSIARPLDKLFILCGGGTQITEVLKQNRIGFKFGPAGRKIKSQRGRHLAYEILQKQKAFVEEKLREKGIVAVVDIPVKKKGEKIRHINGDSYVIAVYPNFGKIYVVTLKGKDKSFLEDFDKIEVIYL